MGIKVNIDNVTVYGAAGVFRHVFVAVDNQHCTEGNNVCIDRYRTAHGRNRAACRFLHIIGADSGRVVLAPNAAALDASTIGGCLKLAKLNQRRRFLLHAYEEMGLTCFEPMGAFYTFPNISRFGMTSEEFATRFLEEEKVAVVPGTAFGDCGEGFVRVSYAYSLDNLKEALGRMERFVKRLDGRE